MAHEDVFKFIKVLTINAQAPEATILSSFREAMAENYGLGLHENALDILDEDDDCGCGEHHHHHHEGKDYSGMARWVDQSPSMIDKLPVGTMFKGITHDSLMFTYQILGESNGEKLWYPVDNLPAVVVKFTEINPKTAKTRTLFVEPTDVALEMAVQMCTPGFFYRITDINDVPTDIFDGEDEDEDEDSPMTGIYFCYSIEGDDQVDFRSVNSILDSFGYINKFQNSYESFIKAAESVTAEKEAAADNIVSEPRKDCVVSDPSTNPIFNNDPNDFVF